ncbi:MAG: hypothetical protein ACK5N0_03725 [Synechococcaceae cyanobacterium]
MNRSLVTVWLLIALVLLVLPGPAGRLLLDLLGGLTLLLLLTPLLLAGLGLLAWRLLSSRVRNCRHCGVSTFRADLSLCPACGCREAAGDDVGGWPAESSAMESLLGFVDKEIPASDVTITVKATGVDDRSSQDPV